MNYFTDMPLVLPVPKFIRFHFHCFYLYNEIPSLVFFFDAFSAGLNILQIDKVLQNRCALDLGWICDSGVDVFERCLIT